MTQVSLTEEPIANESTHKEHRDVENTLVSDMSKTLEVVLNF